MRLIEALIVGLLLITIVCGAAEILSSGISEMDALQDVALDLQDAQAAALLAARSHQ